MMQNTHRCRRFIGAVSLLGASLVLTAPPPEVQAWPPWRFGCPAPGCSGPGTCPEPDGPGFGTWYWLRSPEQEQRFTAGIYNRYCLRCHAADGSGVWDMPDIPNFTDPVWQASRSDAQLARIILEGRGAVMPPFRGTLSLEEAWAMGRYLRSFVPGTQPSRAEMRGAKPVGLPLPRPKPVRTEVAPASAPAIILSPAQH
jgi:mono/diheme cytochrome c family protein